jgi:hypothetical protein
MLDRLLNIFRAESDSGQLVILVVISIILQLIFYGFGDAIINSIIHFAVSALVAVLFAKYLDGSMTIWWKRFYVIIIIGSIISYFFF